jgi:flagellar assembly factor FliW
LILNKDTQFGLCRFPSGGATNQFHLLQSLEDANLAFIVFPTTIDNTFLEATDAVLLANEYDISPAAMLIIHIASIRGDADNRQMSLNIRAPLVLDVNKRSGAQHVFTGNIYPLQRLVSSHLTTHQF